MPNRQKRPVSAPRLATQSKVAENLPAINRADTEALHRDLAEASASVGARIGQIADIAARKAGEEFGRTAGLDPEFRPTGGIGIFSQAYDNAAIDVAVRRLDTELRSQMAQAFDANSGDPDALAVSFEAIRQGFDGALFDAARPGFQATFQNLQTTYARQATRNRAASLRAEQQAAVETDLSTRLRSIEQQAFALGLDAKADAQLAQELTSLRLSLSGNDIDGRPLVAPQASEKIMRQAEVSVARARIMGAFTRLDTLVSQREMLDEIDSDFAKSQGLAKIFDLDQFEEIKRDMVAHMRSKQSRAGAAARVAEEGVKRFERMAENGFAPGAEDLAALRGRVAATGDPELLDTYERAERRLAFQRQIQTATPGQIDAFVRRERERLASGADAESLELVEAAEKLLANMRTELKRDPNGWAARTGVVPLPQIDFSSDEALRQSLSARMASAKEVGQYYGTAPQYFRPDERTALAEQMRADPAFAAGFANAVVDAAGPDAMRAFSELSKDAPVLAVAGSLLAMGSPKAAADASAGASLALSEGFKPLKPGPADARPLAQDVYRKLFRNMPQALNTVQAAADAIYEARARRQGKTVFDPDLYRESLRAAVGEQEIGGATYGGVGFWRGRAVWVPADIRQDRFGDVIAEITDEDLAVFDLPPQDARGRRMTAGDVANANLVTVGSGRYLVAVGDPDGEDPQYMAGTGPNGLYVLDLAMIAPRIRQRRPGLFLGGEDETEGE